MAEFRAFCVIVMVIVSVQSTEQCKHSTKIQDEVPCTYPEGFKFAAGSAAHQVEGAWNLSGKGMNVWDWNAHRHPEFIKDRSNGDVACDFYHKYKEDLQILDDLGVFRFSISWARILPNGVRDKVNQEGIQFYHNLLDEVLKRKLTPLVTLYHFDLPHALEKMGGWLLPEMARFFEAYADLVFQTFGDKVKMWTTINEPIFMSQWDFTNRTNFSTFDYVKAHNILRAHGKAYRLYERKYKNVQKGKVGLVVNGEYCYPTTSSVKDIKAAERCLQFSVGWFLHPICSRKGGYPAIMREFTDMADELAHRTTSRLPEFSEQDKKNLRGACDFIGLNYYLSTLARDGHTGVKFTSTWYSRVVREIDPTLPSSYNDFQQVDPKGLRKLLKWLSNEYPQKDIFITEAGYEDHPGLQDMDRIKFHVGHMRAVREAIYLDHVSVIGYTVWSLLDSFENFFGYTANFGLVFVDFNQTSLPRTVKASGKWFKAYFKKLGHPTLARREVKRKGR